MEISELSLIRFNRNDAQKVSEIIINCLEAAYADSLDLNAYISYYQVSNIVDLAATTELFIVKQNNEIIAVGCIRNGDEIATMYVSTNRQRQGVGSWLLSNLESILKERNIARVKIVAGKNATEFYLKRGYRQIDNQYMDIENIPMEKQL